jgi:hypothetical protein
MILSQYHIFELDTINIYSVLWEQDYGFNGVCIALSQMMEC